MISVGTFMSYDETPLTFQSPDMSECVRQFLEVALPEPPGDADTDEKHNKKQKRTHKQTCKVIQSDLRVSFIFLDYVSHRIFNLSVPIPNPLQQADHVTAEVLMRFIREQMTIPMFDSLRSKSDFSFDCATCDRGANNWKAEAILANDSASVTRLTIPCDLHIGNTVQCRQYQPVKMFVSGMVALSLAQRAPGAISKFRSALRHVLLGRVSPYPVAPPPESDPHAVYKRRVLDLFLDKTKACDRIRYVKLDTLLTGDLHDWHITWCTGTDEYSVTDWADEVSAALFPYAIPLS
eukprot:7697066-Pyramimonas_sp.AAC.1